MASFLKIDIHFAKYLGSSHKAGKPTHLHTWIIPQAQKHWICNGFIPQNGCSLCKVPGRLSQGNKPTTYIHTWIILQAQKHQIAMASFLKIDVHFAKYPLPQDNHSWFQLSGMWDWNSLHYASDCWSYCCTLCGVSSSHKVTKVMPPQACFVGNSCHLQSSSISYEHPDHHQLLLWDSAAFCFFGWLHIAK